MESRGFKEAESYSNCTIQMGRERMAQEDREDGIFLFLTKNYLQEIETKNNIGPFPTF
jgi:hypothetical protein